MKLAAIALILVFGAASSVATAGVTPNSAASAAARSGARIAPAKDNTQTPSTDKAQETDAAK